MNIEITEVSLKKPNDNSSGLTAAIDTKKKEIAGKETMEEAWIRVFGMKNSESDMTRLREAKQAFENGIVGRQPGKNGKKFSKSEAKWMYDEIKRMEIQRVLTEMVEDIPDNYELVTDETRLDEVVDELLAEEIIVFDVETTGTNVYRDKLVGHVLSVTSTDRHYYIPTGHRTSQKQLDEALVMRKLKPVYEDKSIKKIAHNAKFDYQMLKRAGITTENIYWDTQEAMKILNENEPSFALKPLVTEYLKIDSYGYADLFGKNTGFDEVELDLALAYAAKDGDITWKLYEFQKKHLAHVGNSLEYFVETEMPVLRVVSDMELRGYVLDMEFVSEYGAKLEKDIAELYENVVKGLGDINLNSPVQLKAAIEKHVGHMIENTDAKQTLKPLSKKFPLIKELLNYRKLNKLYTTYIGAIPELIEPSTGRLHTVFNQNGAKTGRFSSSGGVNLNMWAVQR